MNAPGDYDFVEDTRLLRRWLNRETVPSVPLAAELRRWADYIAPAVSVPVSNPPNEDAR